MPVYTKHFDSTDEYEKWFQEVGERIVVMAINNSPTLHGQSTATTSGPITVRYQTADLSLAPERNKIAMIVEVAIVAVLFFGLFLYLITEF